MNGNNQIWLTIGKIQSLHLLLLKSTLLVQTVSITYIIRMNTSLIDILFKVGIEPMFNGCGCGTVVWRAVASDIENLRFESRQSNNLRLEGGKVANMIKKFIVNVRTILLTTFDPFKSRVNLCEEGVNVGYLNGPLFFTHNLDKIWSGEESADLRNLLGQFFCNIWCTERMEYRNVWPLAILILLFGFCVFGTTTLIKLFSLKNFSCRGDDGFPGICRGCEKLA